MLVVDAPVAHFGSADDYVIDPIIFDTDQPASIYARYPEFKKPENKAPDLIAEGGRRLTPGQRIPVYAECLAPPPP
jgi:hypothetical protein